MPLVHPPLPDENTYPGALGSSHQLATTEYSPSSGTLTLSADNNMGSNIVYRTISKSSSIQSLRHKFSTGSLFGRSKGKEPEKNSTAEGSLQQLQSLFDSCKPVRNRVQAEVERDVERERCDCVVPCLCDVLGKDLGGGAQVLVGQCTGEMAVEMVATEHEPDGDGDTLIDLYENWGPTDHGGKVCVQGRPVLHVNTVIPDTLRGEGYTPRDMEAKGLLIEQHGPNSRTLKHKVGTVQPTQCVSNISANTPQFVFPPRPSPAASTTRQPFISLPSPNTLSSSIPSTSSAGPASCLNHPSQLRPQEMGRTASSSSLLTTSTTRSLSSYVSGTASSHSSRPGTPRSSISDRDSAFAKKYVSFPPYQAGSGGGVGGYAASSLEDLGTWVGGVGRRLTRRMRKESESQQAKAGGMSVDEGEHTKGKDGESKRGWRGRRGD